MYYIVGLATLTVAVMVILSVYQKWRQKSRREELRQKWGRRKEGFFEFESIEKYALLNKDDGFHRLPAQVLHDIDFYELFRFLDRTTSRPGQQYFFHYLTSPDNSIEKLRALDARAQLFSSDAALREDVQEQLFNLSHQDAYHISSLLGDQTTKRPYWLKWLYLDTFLVIALLGLAQWFPVTLLFLLVPFAINLNLHFWNKNQTFRFSRSFPQLSQLVMTCSNLLNKDISIEKGEVELAIKSLKPFQKKMSLLSFGDSGGVKDELSVLLFYVVDLLKALFLVELYALVYLREELLTKQKDVKTLFHFVGDLDVALSVASLRSGKLKTCVPDFTTPEKTFTIRNSYHPLVKDCVANSLNVDSRSVLITGSNMSGKTTFLRTLIINSILAQTIYTCFAEEFSTPFLRQYSSIRIDDNLLDNKSYYFEEVSVMSSLIHEVGSGQQNVFVLDEVFKGTNTIERIAAAKAVLSYLNKGNNIVFVSTHDIELAEMLKSSYDLYHFSETIDENNELRFDHQLKQGPLTTRNAIRILALANYPDEIVTEATRLSETLGLR